MADTTRALREMLSSGRLTKLVPMKNGGRLSTETIEQEGPIAFVESTTVGKIFDEDRNRCVLVHTDESESQTVAVLKFSAMCHEGQREVDSSSVIAKHHAAQRMLPTHEVVIPFARCVAQMMNAARVEARRAFSLLMSCVKASALLHQYQRNVDVEHRLIATLEDYELAIQLMLPSVTGRFKTGQSWALQTRPFCLG